MSITWRYWDQESDEGAILRYFKDREWAHLYLAGFVYKALINKQLRRYILLAYYVNKEHLAGIMALDMNKRLLVDCIADLTPFYISIKKVLSQWSRPYCIIGRPESLFWLESFYGKDEYFIAIDYSLMVLSWQEMKNVSYMNPQAIQFCHTLLDDYKKLLPLEIGYQKEEVMVAKQHILSESTIASYFKSRLEQEDNFHLEYKGHALAKAAINVQGLYYDQVAGVYTDPRLRGRGLAKILFGHLLSYYYREQKRGLALFVKQQNQQAIALYKSLGFKHKQPFRISYL